MTPEVRPLQKLGPCMTTRFWCIQGFRALGRLAGVQKAEGARITDAISSRFPWLTRVIQGASAVELGLLSADAPEPTALPLCGCPHYHSAAACAVVPARVNSKCNSHTREAWSAA